MALNMFVLASTQLETNIVSVERVKEYAETEIEVKVLLAEVAVAATYMFMSLILAC